MKIPSIKSGRKWALYGGVFTAIAYAALTLNSEPAYASNPCTESQCIDTCAELVCPTRGGFEGYSCNAPGSGDVTCDCVDGNVISLCD